MKNKEIKLDLKKNIYEGEEDWIRRKEENEIQM